MCKNVTFVDVDYAQLMVKKCEIIDLTNLFRKMLTSFKISSPGDTITLRSDQYLAVGCDLRDTEKLKRALAEELDLENCLILCTAEVSITYMDVEAADALIGWAAKLRDGESGHGTRMQLLSGRLIWCTISCSPILSS